MVFSHKIYAMIKRFTDTGDNNIMQKEDDLSLQSLEDIFILNLQKTLFVWFVAYSTGADTNPVKPGN